jgi:nicotinate-nucleotide--dimethylbenzimidazole phosphoribosyltransferase
MTGQGDIAAAARVRLDALAKPPGSLGRLERLAVRLAETQRSLSPVTRPRRLVVFAGDHGVVEEGVGLWPDAVTVAMMRLMLEGRASSAVLARQAGAGMVLVDAGSKAPSFAGPGYRDWRVERGTANLARGPAMGVDGFEAALAVGARAAAEAAAEGVRVLALGEMGIGNTTAAACLTALLAEQDAEAVTGPGAGATEATLARKHAVVAEAVARARAMPDRRAAMASVAGYEIVAMAGCMVEAVAARDDDGAGWLHRRRRGAGGSGARSGRDPRRHRRASRRGAGACAGAGQARAGAVPRMGDAARRGQRRDPAAAAAGCRGRGADGGRDARRGDGRMSWPRAAATSLQFLTRLPVPGGASADPASFAADLRRALALFPLAGALVGALSGAVLLLADLGAAAGARGAGRAGGGGAHHRRAARGCAGRCLRRARRRAGCGSRCSAS